MGKKVFVYRSPRDHQMAIYAMGEDWYWIHHWSEIDLDWLRGVETIGLTAGIATTEKSLKDCIRFLHFYGVTEVEIC